MTAAYQIANRKDSRVQPVEHEKDHELTQVFRQPVDVEHLRGVKKLVIPDAVGRTFSRLRGVADCRTEAGEGTPCR